MTTLNLKEEYLKAVSFLRGEDSTDAAATLLHRTPWVRILLDHGQQGSGSLSIEVEISVPDSEETESSVLIDKLHEHLQYLQRLRNIGFELSVIEAGCIYCASKELHETPEDNLFRAFIPP